MECSAEDERQAKRALFNLAALYRIVGIMNSTHKEHNTLFDVLYCGDSISRTAQLWKRPVEESQKHYDAGISKINVATGILFQSIDLSERSGLELYRCFELVNTKHKTKPTIKRIPPETPIENLDLKYHTLRVLRYLRVNTYADLKTVTKARLKAVRNCGPNTIKDIKRELLSNGVRLS